MSRSDKIKKRYNRYAYFYDLFEWLPEKLIFAKYRKEIMPKLTGKILEIGAGTGKNFPYYNDSAEVTAIDFSDKMLARAEAKLKKLNRKNITLKQADAQNLPFADNNFDIVLATFVFCSVPDPIKGFREVKRVLKPDGRAIFLEHVKSKTKLKGIMQDLLNPLTVGIFGYNINRKTRDNINMSGLNLFEDKYLAMNDVLRLFSCGK